VLGIPTVPGPRVATSTALPLLENDFDGDFPSVELWLPRAQAHQAIRKAQLFIRRYRVHWVVDMTCPNAFEPRWTMDLILAASSGRK